MNTQCWPRIGSHMVLLTWPSGLTLFKNNRKFPEDCIRAVMCLGSLLGSGLLWGKWEAEVQSVVTVVVQVGENGLG